jgi:hypothetical protein
MFSVSIGEALPVAIGQIHRQGMQTDIRLGAEAVKGWRDRQGGEKGAVRTEQVRDCGGNYVPLVT